jgi:hypothetical protein
LDQEEKTAMSRKMMEMERQLVALTISRRALGDIVLGAGQGSALLACCLDEAHFQVDSLISEGVRCGARAALTLVNSYYGDINFEAIRRGYALGKSEGDVLDISSASATARSVEILASKMSAASIHL